MKMKILNTELRLVQGDITGLDVDAIVNAASGCDSQKGRSADSDGV